MVDAICLYIINFVYYYFGDYVVNTFLKQYKENPMLYRSLLATVLCLALSIPSVQAQNSELVSITNFNNILPADCDSLLPPLIINNSNGTFTVDYELDLSLNMFPTGIQNYSTGVFQGS